MLVVAVAAGALWYSTDGEFFQGYLKRKDAGTHTPQNGVELPGEQTEEQCKLYKEWFAMCEYSCRIDNGSILPLTACQNSDDYKEYMKDWPTQAECDALDKNDPNVDPADIAYCETEGCLHTQDVADDKATNALCEEKMKEEAN